MSDSEIPNGWLINAGLPINPENAGDYFTISNLDSQQKTISLYVSVDKLYYSFDDHIWEYILSSDLPEEVFEASYRKKWTFNLQGNSKVRFKANNDLKYYNATFDFSNDTRKLTGINISGNIQTLSVGDDYKNLQNKATKCDDLFSGCVSWTFDGLTLPATKLAEGCYWGMFSGCKGLTSIPKGFLPATKLAESCYFSMFGGCTGLTSIPEDLLPATELGYSCYCAMFAGCTGLTSIPEDLLPASVLTQRCYERMFEGCTNILKSPVLPARVLTYGCYERMFAGCTKLCEITFNGVQINSDFTQGWCIDVSSTGKIISLNKDLEIITTGTSGVPEGWEVIYKDSTTN